MLIRRCIRFLSVQKLNLFWKAERERGREDERRREERRGGEERERREGGRDHFLVMIDAYAIESNEKNKQRFSILFV